MHESSGHAGPNNPMVAALAGRSACTLPHILGVAVGFAVMAMAIGVGLAKLLAAHPGIHRWLRVVSVASEKR